MQAETTVDARARRFELSPQAFRRLAFAGAVALFLIVASGATVRLTASGLGCEHWPGCAPGHPFPEKDHHAFIEFGNRVVSALTIGATLLVWLGSLRTPGLTRGTRWLAFATFFGTLAQAPLGAITVYADLHPLLVMTHFLLALAVLGAGVLLVLRAVELEVGAAVTKTPTIVRRGALVLAGAALVMVVTGTFATAAGPHPGGEDVRRLWTLYDAVYLHVRGTAVFGVTFLVVLVWLWRRRAVYPRLLEAGFVVLGLLLLQMMVGELQYRTELPWWLVLVHVSLAAAVWAAVVAFASLLRDPPASMAPVD
jgi:cytochrome c oxidase assembly protein subunit 15